MVKKTTKEINYFWLINLVKKTKMSQAEQVAVQQISISGFAKIESSIFEIFHIFNKFRLKTHLHDTIQFDKMILYISWIFWPKWDHLEFHRSLQGQDSFR